jgi:hypothetical protein
MAVFTKYVQVIFQLASRKSSQCLFPDTERQSTDSHDETSSLANDPAHPPPPHPQSKERSGTLIKGPSGQIRSA